MFSFRNTFLIGLFFSIFINAQSQQLLSAIDSIKELTSNQQKIEAFTKVLQMQDTSSRSESLGTLYHELGSSYYDLKVYDKAFSFIMKATEIRRGYQNIVALNESRYKLAAIYKRLGKAKKRYLILLEIINNNGADRYTCNAHRILSKIERNKGDFYKALEYLNLGLANTKLCSNPQYDSQIRFEIIIAYGKKYQTIFDAEKKNFDLQSVKVHQGIIEKNAKTGQYSLAAINTAAMYNSIAMVYDAFGELENALHYYKKAKHFIPKGNIEVELAITLNIGVIYSKQKKHELATQAYQYVLDKSTYKNRLARTYDDMGYYLPNTSAREKIHYFQKAITMILGSNSIATTPFKLPTLAEIKKSGYEQSTLTYLIDLADHYVQAYEEEQDSAYLVQAKEVAYLIDQLVSLMRYESTTEQSKLFWIEKGVNVYMLAVKVCYLTGDVESAFYFMEKNKSLLLQENITALQAKLALTIPKGIIEKEHHLKYEFIALQEQFRQNANDVNIRESYAAKNKIYVSYMDSIQQLYPDYVKTKREVNIVTFNDIINEYSAKNQCFVEYVLNKNDGYGIYFHKGEPLFFNISNVPELQRKLENLKAYMKKRVVNTEELKMFKKLAYSVFNTLFPSKNIQQELSGKKITVIADDALQQLPFEALLTREKGAFSDNYLLQIAEISYLQSFSLYSQIKEKKNTPKRKLLAIAPYQFQDENLTDLEGTKEVIQILADYSSSLILFEKEASKENFLKERNNFEIIHFNTHAGLDTVTQAPWIAFRKEKMTLNELFGLENQAELVILDACKTNDGKRFSGEGIMNLSRGFFYNGTQSVLASLWNVNEVSGNEIINTFYTKLQEGSSKSKALQQAKKKYLKNHEHAQVLPYYWAAFTLTGNTAPITLHTKTKYIWYIISGLILVSLLFYFYREKHFRALVIGSL